MIIRLIMLLLLICWRIALVSEYIQKKLQEVAKANGVIASEKLEEISEVKFRKFGEDSWEKCPVEPDNVERFCCSQLCQSEIRGLGACMCGLFVRGKND